MLNVILKQHVLFLFARLDTLTAGARAQSLPVSVFTAELES